MKSKILQVHNNEFDIINNNIVSEDNTYINYKNCVCIKPWGYEFLAYESNKIGIWFLQIKKGHGTSLHTHFKKDTFVIVLDGSAKLSLINNETYNLGPMSSVFVPKNKFHAFSSFSDEVYLLEIEIFDSTTTFSNKNDLLRIDDQYKRKKTGYSGSVDVVYDNLEKYDYFWIKDNLHKKIYNAQINTHKINNISDLNKLNGQYNILLDGNIYINGLYIKEGSIISNINIESDNIFTNNNLVLSISNKYYEENSKLIYSQDQLKCIINEIHNKNKKVILTSGCYDILHVGHLHTLKESKDLGDILMVCLSNDTQIKALKGNNRPINNYNDRINLFKTILYVDYIILYEESNIEKEESLDEIMKIVNPYYWTKGSDYTIEQITDKHPSLQKIILIDNIKDKSTTNIITKINNS